MERYAIAVLLLIGAACARKQPAGQYKALSPQEELQSFRVNGDFRVELLASEPMVFNPVDMVFDENGKIYVAEMLDYPKDPPPGQPARSRIALLEDTDGDGKVDRRTVYADNVLEVSGIMPWKGGLIVTSAPDIVFMKDTDGDGKADIREVLYTGFPKVHPEGRITNPRLGIDNWIYAANGGADSRITEPGHPERPPIVARGRDFRFRPDRGIAEPASGPTQFGLTFDDWGNRFITQNTMHVRQVVMPAQYLMKAPLLEVGAVAEDISDHGRPSARMFPLTQPQEWRVERTNLRQQRYRENHLEHIRPLDASLEMASGYFTAASGGTVYSGDQFPAKYRGNLFTGDVSGNLVHRDILTAEGVIFRASRAPEEQNQEFLASTDGWFRPCNFANGPDGFLYITDMYRETIEQPESIPEAIKKNINFWSGVDKGRLWRIVPVHPLRNGNLKPNLGAAGSAELVRQLANSNGWNRQTAQRLLVERQDRATIPMLEEMAAKNEMPQARLHALWTLEGLSALTPSQVEHALHDSYPAIREHALRLSEPLLSGSKALTDAVLAMVKDPEPRVQFQLACTLGEFQDSRTLPALANIASAHTSDQWFRTAVLSSVRDSAFQLFTMLQKRPRRWGDGQFLSELAALIGAKHDVGEMTGVINTLAALQGGDAELWRNAGLLGLGRGLKLVNASELKVPAAETALMKMVDSPPQKTQNAAREVAEHVELRAFIQKASEQALASNLPTETREIAIRSLRGGQFAMVGPALRKLLDPKEPPNLQAAAVDSLAAFDNPSISSILLENWRAYSPDVRKKALVAMLESRDRAPDLLKAMDAHQIEPSAFDAGARDRLLQNPDPVIRQRAEALFLNRGSDRAQVVRAYRQVAGMSGDPNRGKQAFEKNCGKCHLPRRLGGQRVGPDLSGVNNKSKEELLNSILNPSAEIEPRFTNYVVITKDNRLHDGIIVNETPGALTLRGDSEEGDVTILRRNISEIRASSVSLMPDDLEKQLSKQDLADVIAYLRAGL